MKRKGLPILPKKQTSCWHPKASSLWPKDRCNKAAAPQIELKDVTVGSVLWLLQTLTVETKHCRCVINLPKKKKKRQEGQEVCFIGSLLGDTSGVDLLQSRSPFAGTPIDIFSYLVEPFGLLREARQSNWHFENMELMVKPLSTRYKDSLGNHKTTPQPDITSIVTTPHNLARYVEDWGQEFSSLTTR